MHSCSLVGFQDHHDFLKGCVACPFADTVDSDLYLTRAVDYAGHCVGRSHTEVIVAVGGDDGLVDAIHVLLEVLDFLTVLGRKAVTGSVGDVHYCCPGLDDSLHHPGKIFILCPAGVFSVEFHILDVLFGVLDSPDRAFYDLFAGGVELVPDVVVRSTDPCVDSLALGVLERLGGAVNVLLHSP